MPLKTKGDPEKAFAWNLHELVHSKTKRGKARNFKESLAIALDMKRKMMGGNK